MNTCQAFIEITQGSSVKYEWNEDLKLLQAVRTLPKNFFFPTNYGFIPKTFAEDGDDLDIFVFSSAPLMTPTLVTAKVVGVLQMKDKGVRDDKIIAYMDQDRNWTHQKIITEWPKDLLEGLHYFYREVKRLENKAFEFLGIKGEVEAMSLIKTSGLQYEEKKIRS